jgi:predicted RNase H-like nuclease (RuvC/YqgF family)
MNKHHSEGHPGKLLLLAGMPQASRNTCTMPECRRAWERFSMVLELAKVEVERQALATAQNRLAGESEQAQDVRQLSRQLTEERRRIDSLVAQLRQREAKVEPAKTEMRRVLDYLELERAAGGKGFTELQQRLGRLLELLD